MLQKMFLDKKFIGQKFKEYRKKKGLSQEQLAEKAELALKHYGRLERGTCIPTLETFFKLVEVLNIPITEFGIDIEKVENTNTNRNELLKEIYLSNEKEIKVYLNLIRSIKELK